MGDAVLSVVFQGWAELLAQRGHLERAGLFVPPPEPLPEPFSELTVRVVAPDGRSVEIQARVVQIAPQAGIALACSDVDGARSELAPLFEAAAAAAHDGAASPVASGWEEPGELPAQGGTAAAATPASAADDPATLHDRVRALSTSEKMRLARNGDRAERMILLKDPNKTIQLHIIQNKRITIDEIRYMAANRQANPEVLGRIADTREWMQHPGVVTALVNNPKTPSPTALRLVRSLQKSELRRLAKSPNAPRAVAIAARKILATSS